MKNFDDYSTEELKKAVNEEWIHPNDCVVLVQSQPFRIDEYRIRIGLFDKGLSTIEHVHLGIYPEDQFSQYVDSLGFSAEKVNLLFALFFLKFCF